MAAICSVCAEPFTKYMREFTDAPWPSSATRKANAWTMTRWWSAAGSAGWSRRSSSATWATGPGGREGGQRRWQDDPSQQGLPDAGLRELHLHPEDGRDHPPPQHRRPDLRRGGGHPRATATARTTRNPPEAEVHRRGRLHRLPAVRDGLHRGRSRPVQRRHGVAAGGVHRLPPGGAKEGRHRAGRRLALHLQCPAGIKAHGYVLAVRSGEYDKAFDLVLETTPLVGTLGRACYAPCEGSARAASWRASADPPAQALHRRPRYARRRARQSRAPSERQEGRRRGLGPGRA